jgi:hypothetical protein
MVAIKIILTKTILILTSIQLLYSLSFSAKRLKFDEFISAKKFFNKKKMVVTNTNKLKSPKNKRLKGDF